MESRLPRSGEVDVLERLVFATSAAGSESIYLCKYVYIYIYIERERVYIYREREYIYIYIERER